MKKNIFLLLVIYNSLIFSQETFKITYEVKNKGQKITSTSVNGILPPEVSKAKLMSKINNKKIEWFGNKRYALYQKKKREKAAGMMFSSKSIMLKSGSFNKKNRSFPYDEFETSLWDYKEYKRIGVAKIFKKDFRVNLNIPKAPRVVKITDNKKKILGYTAKEAVIEHKNGTKESYWFTDEIKAISPYHLKGIKGVILQMDLRSKSIKAVKIEKVATGNNVFKDFLNQYKSTKVISKNQYRDLKKEEQDEKMASLKNVLKGSNINLDSILKEARKKAQKKMKKNN
ncbi:hypothetical protein [Polaribacter porphyrae]|uniref:GLPGLI family protein n=1 Tax=Polaribacter porphyrae TaxID=1137780 RepID=A0A2S7WPL4_9FLAO|nr:hypothetical protein [Polaribacter porphyrae]PQJ79262.1 hypothetical protein BTO18_08790 [Polaribacter porphyrae]